MSAVLFEVDADGVAVITLNRPEAKNSLNNDVMNGLRDAFGQVVNDPKIRVVVMTGAGGTFCSGMDLKAFARGDKIDGTGLPFSGENALYVEKPLIAAVEGYCLAGGFEVALSCDLIVSSETAKFGLPEVKRGLAAAGGGLVRMPRQAPWRVALEMVLTGDHYDAATMEKHGVINRITPEGGALAGAKALAATIAANGPLAVAASKRIMTESLDWKASEARTLQQPYITPVFASNDAKEGATAFAEKRKPNWTNS